MEKSKSKILIVEDEQDIRQTLADEFVRGGFNVREAKNGKEGLESALKEHPDLILLDIVMPEMDGMTMAKRLRKDEYGKDVPIIMLTNLSDVGKVSSAVESDVYDYLIKSDWKMEDVVTKVKARLAAS